MLCDHLTDASLSLWILIGPLVNRLYNLRSLRRLIICRRTFVHSSTAYISASVELRAVIVWRLEHQWTGPPSQMTNPDMDLDLKRSSCSWWCGFGVDASWGPQFASVKGVSLDGSTGNLTNDSRGLQSLLENRIPMSLVPLRYFMTCFAASMWPGEGFEVYLAIMLVIVAISGRV